MSAILMLIIFTSSAYAVNISEPNNCNSFKEYVDNFKTITNCLCEKLENLNEVGANVLISEVQKYIQFDNVNSSMDLDNLCKLYHCLMKFKFNGFDLKRKLEEQINNIAIDKLTKSIVVKKYKIYAETSNVLDCNLEFYHLLNLSEQVLTHLDTNSGHIYQLLKILKAAGKMSNVMKLNICFVIKLYEKLKHLHMTQNTMQFAVADVIRTIQESPHYHSLRLDVQQHLHNTKIQLSSHVRALFFSTSICIQHKYWMFYLGSGQRKYNNTYDADFSLQWGVNPKTLWNSHSHQYSFRSFTNNLTKNILYVQLLNPNLHGVLNESTYKFSWRFFVNGETSSEFFIESISHANIKLCINSRKEISLIGDKNIIEPCLWLLSDCSSFLAILNN